MPQVFKQNPSQKNSTPISQSKPDSVLNRIVPIGFDEDDGLTICLYGRSGTGKTTLWSTFPRPILAAIVSGGSKPGELRSIDTPANRKTISQVVLHKSAELKDIVHYVADSGKYATLVLDHATGLQDLVLKEILGLEEVPAQKGWGIASKQQYGQCTLQCKELMRAMLGLDCNVVIVAQEREFNTEDESDVIMPYVGAALSPSLAGWLHPACDYVCETFIRQKEELVKTSLNGKPVETKKKIRGEVEYCLRTGPDPIYTTKFRLPKGTKLPDVIVDPSYEKIHSLIRSREAK